MNGLRNECLKGKAMERMRNRKKKNNTGPLSPKKDREPELPGAVIPGLVCD